MGVTDEMKLHFEEVLTGSYYEKYPKLPRDKGVRFGYDIVDESDREYAKLVDNIKGERVVMTIKTDDNIDFKITGYITTQDGLFWQITGVIKRVKHENTKEALRFLKTTIQTSYLIRLINAENPMEIK